MSLTPFPIVVMNSEGLKLLETQTIKQVKWRENDLEFDMTLVAIPPLSTEPGIESEFYLVGFVFDPKVNVLRGRFSGSNVFHKMLKVEPDGFYEYGMLTKVDPYLHQVCVEHIARLAKD